MSYVKWNCKYCTYENYPASLKCVICYQLKNSPVIEPPPLIYQKRNSLKTHKDKEKEGKLSSINKEKQSDLIINCSLDDNKNNLNSNDCATKNKRNIIQNEDNARLKCHNCTYQNDISKIQCEMCSTALIAQNTPGATASNQEPVVSTDTPQLCKEKFKVQNSKWVCANCTYANWERSTKCVMCLTLKNVESTSTIGTNINAQKLATSSSESEDCTEESEASQTCENNKTAIENKSNRPANKSKVAQSLSVPNISPSFRTRSSSSSSNSSNSSTKDESSSPSNGRSTCYNNAVKAGTSASYRNGACSGSYLQRSSSKSRISSNLRKELKALDNCDIECTRHIKNRMKNLNLLFLKACIGKTNLR